MQPSLFLAHGSPRMAIEDSKYTEYLAKLGEQLQPKAIVIFTSHWESSILTISSMNEEYETIYDFYGFPEELYAIKYKAKGSVEIASMLEKKFKDYGIEVKKDSTRGLDHGSWTLLYRMYPMANIPVIQISVNPFLSPGELFKIGEALQGIGKEDILVIGSGNTIHNLRILRWGQTSTEPWAIAFDDWLIEKIQNRDLESFFSYEELAPNAKYAVPRPDHFVPLFISMGSGDPDKKVKVIHRNYEAGSLSYLCFEF